MSTRDNTVYGNSSGKRKFHHLLEDISGWQLGYDFTWSI
jgi:hypothetical protein